jgi:hypothetical protein
LGETPPGLESIAAGSAIDSWREGVLTRQRRFVRVTSVRVPHHLVELRSLPLALDSARITAALATPQAVHALSIAQFSRAEWNALVIEPARDWFYFQALERLALPGFSPVYFGVRCDGRLRGAVAGFLLEGAWRPHRDGMPDQLARVLHRIRRSRGARALVLGSPLNEPCGVGLAPDADEHERRDLLAHMLGAADEFASRYGYGVLAVKDACASTEELWAWACEGLHLKRLRSGLPQSAVATSSWYRAEKPWLNWCYSVIDHAFGFDLRDEELRQLLGSSDSDHTR